MAKRKESFEAVLTNADLLQIQLREGWTSIAQGLLTIARDLPDVEAFIAGCAKAESERRTRLNEKAQAEHWQDADRRRRIVLPQSWSNAKSQIKRLWTEYGQHPKQFESYYALRERLRSLRARTHQAPRRPSAGYLPETVAGKRADALLERLWKLPEDYQQRVLESAERLVGTYEAVEKQIAQAEAPPARVAAAH